MFDGFDKVGGFFEGVGGAFAGFGDFMAFLFEDWEWWVPGVIIGAIAGAYFMGSLTGGAQGFGALIGGIGGFIVSYQMEKLF